MNTTNKRRSSIHLRTKSEQLPVIDIISLSNASLDNKRTNSKRIGKIQTRRISCG